jgi:hypothetical protein
MVRMARDLLIALEHDWSGPNWDQYFRRDVHRLSPAQFLRAKLSLQGVFGEVTIDFPLLDEAR